MAKKVYDPTTKQLVELHPRDWLVLARLPLGDGVRVVDADLSSFTAAADKVLLVEGLLPYIAHFEFQTGIDVTLDRRVLLYNALLRWRFDLPVRSVVIMLRPEALSSANTGRVQDATWPETRLDFAYKIVRVWEESPAALLAGGVGTLPLAPISAVPAEELNDVVIEMERRLASERPAEAADLETAAYILMGLRYPRAVIDRLLQGIKQMKESVTYQAIIQEGEARGEAHGEARGKNAGRVEGERSLLLHIGRKKLGPPSASALQAIETISDLQELQALAERVLDVSSWEQLLRQ